MTDSQTDGQHRKNRLVPRIGPRTFTLNGAKCTVTDDSPVGQGCLAQGKHLITTTKDGEPAIFVADHALVLKWLAQ